MPKKGATKSRRSEKCQQSRKRSITLSNPAELDELRFSGQLDKSPERQRSRSEVVKSVGFLDPAVHTTVHVYTQDPSLPLLPKKERRRVKQKFDGSGIVLKRKLKEERRRDRTISEGSIPSDTDSVDSSDWLSSSTEDLAKTAHLQALSTRPPRASILRTPEVCGQSKDGGDYPAVSVEMNTKTKEDSKATAVIVEPEEASGDLVCQGILVAILAVAMYYAMTL